MFGLGHIKKVFLAVTSQTVTCCKRSDLFKTHVRVRTRNFVNLGFNDVDIYVDITFTGTVLQGK